MSAGVLLPALIRRRTFKRGTMVANIRADGWGEYSGSRRRKRGADVVWITLRETAGDRVAGGPLFAK